jgi:transcriptional regulator with XRE-family HTH domain
LKRERGYTVQQFADTFGAKLNTVRDWLNARVLPRIEALRNIALHFSVTTDWLLGIPGAPKFRTQSRTEEKLEHDVSERIRQAVIQDLAVTWPWIVEGKLEVDGRTALAAMIGLAKDRARNQFSELMSAFDTMANQRKTGKDPLRALIRRHSKRLTKAQKESLAVSILTLRLHLPNTGQIFAHSIVRPSEELLNSIYRPALKALSDGISEDVGLANAVSPMALLMAVLNP